MNFPPLVLLLLSARAFNAAAAAASITSITRQVELGSNEYFLPPTPAWSFKSWSRNATSRFPADGPLVPLSVVYVNDSSASASNATADVLRTTFKAFGDMDDVWTEDFASYIYLQYASTRKGSLDNNGTSSSSYSDVISQLALEYNVTGILSSANYNISIGISHSANNGTVPMGPYFLDIYTGAVYRAYRLYVDESQAFIQSSYQDSDGTHYTLRAAASRSAAGLTVAVPSRLYYTPSAKRPLDGMRIAVKDLYDLKGMKTSGGSKAYFDTSEVKNKTATSVQKLIDAGAVIVGKNKLSMFAFGGPYITDHIDYLLPVNPRGDAYNTPGDSSGGSGSAVASYEWLDASMGSDTGGSIRGPAMVNGVLGNRPSQDAVSLDGALPLSTSMDTCGILARDPVKWSAINKVLYSGFAKQYPRYPRKIYVNAENNETLVSGTDTNDYNQIFSDFVQAVINITNGSAISYSIDTAWNSSNHSSTLQRRTLGSNIGRIYTNLTHYEQWKAFGEGFITNYTSTHDGKFPYVTYSTLRGWLDANKTITTEIYKDDLSKKQEISTWARRNFLRPDNQSCSDSIYLTFVGPGFETKPDVSGDLGNPYIAQMSKDYNALQEKYIALNVTLACNATLNPGFSLNPNPIPGLNSTNSTTTNSTYSSSPPSCEEALTAASQASQFTVHNVSDARLASIVGFPQFAVTLGTSETQYSNITRQNQSIPVAVLMMMGYGCDFVLQDLVEDLYSVGAIPRIRAGGVVS